MRKQIPYQAKKSGSPKSILTTAPSALTKAPSRASRVSATPDALRGSPKARAERPAKSQKFSISIDQCSISPTAIDCGDMRGLLESIALKALARWASATTHSVR